MATLVAAVMPTSAGRSRFWRKAVDGFIAQTYRPLRLYVLNEGGEAYTPLVFREDGIYYARLSDEKLTTGTKRNRINEDVDADVIIHFDDDDWHATDFVARLVALLEASKKPVVGFDDCLYYRSADRTFWKYQFQRKPPYATGTSLCYKRSYWQFNRFADKRVGEDATFALAARESGDLASEASRGAVVAIAHGENTYTPRFGRSPFVQARREEFPKAFLEEINR